jgi:TrmH RNA methyltransferase
MSNDRKPPSPYKGPPAQRMDKRARERQREAPPPRALAQEEAAAPRERQPPSEQRMYGLNACLALFAHRPEAIRKVWLLESRIPVLKPVLAHCVKHRLGYTIVEAEDLERLSSSAHHEGVVFGALPAAELPLSSWLRDLPAGPQVALWLDGVGNPHNLGAILRSAAHFGAGGLLLPKTSLLAVSGAAARVAEGGAEFVPVVRLGRAEHVLEQLKAAGFVVAATAARGGASIFATKLPQRLVFIMGAEQAGVDAQLAQASELRLEIPGRGAVESLNVASAASVLLSEWTRQQLPRR